jgi:hypothetical protein
MSDTPIFDRLSSERNYRRLLDYKEPEKAPEGSQKASQPDEYLDGPLHMIGAQSFDDGEIQVTPWIKEGAVAGLTGTPFDRERIEYFQHNPVSLDSILQSHPDMKLKMKSSLLERLREEKELRPETMYGVVWNSEEEAERQAEFSEMFQKYVSDTAQMIQQIREEGGIVTRVDVVEESGGIKTVVEGVQPTYKPLFEGEATEE